jgi:hypothetical protein
MVVKVTVRTRSASIPRSGGAGLAPPSSSGARRNIRELWDVPEDEVRRVLEAVVTVVGDRDTARAAALKARYAGNCVAVVSDTLVSPALSGAVELAGRASDTRILNEKILVTLSSGEEIRTSSLVPASILDPALYCSI